jgi:predicted methyltransferase
MPAAAVSRAHELLRGHLQPGDTVIDATAGNGHDTLLLAQLIAPGGRVFAFDIQPAALVATRSRLESAGIPAESWQLIQAGHETMPAAIPPELHGRIAAVVFNLGYLPGGDKTITTSPAGTVAAMRDALQLLRPGGLLVAVLYTGHPGGAEEADAVRAFAAALPRVSWQIEETPPAPTLRPAPSVLHICNPAAASRTFPLSLTNSPLHNSRVP